MTTVMTQVIARLLFLPTLITAIGILVKGYASAGDGFSAGVVAAIGILLQYVAFGYRKAETLLPPLFAPLATAGGLLIALTVAFVPALMGRPILTHAPAAGEYVIHLGTVELATAVAFDLGIFLLVLGFSVGVINVVARTIEADQAEAGQS